MELLARFQEAIIKASDSVLRHDKLGVLWANLPPVSSYAWANGDKIMSIEAHRRKKKIAKIWPELAEMLDEIADNSPNKE